MTFRVRVELEHSSPPIWRLLEVRSDLSLDAVHHVLQTAFGWSDSHLYRFALGNPFDPHAELFLCSFDVEEGEDEGTPASDAALDETLSEAGDVLNYCYDYGDSWDLTLTLESTRPLTDTAPVATCVDGARAAPPEDCGGLRTEAELSEVLLDPGHFDLVEINQALADPYLQLREGGVHPGLVDILNKLRDTGTRDDLVVRTMSLSQLDPSSPEQRAAALHPFLWFLERVGSDGLPLTSAGYLRPQDVQAAATVVPDMAQWIGTANREYHTVPVLRFRESL